MSPRATSRAHGLRLGSRKTSLGGFARSIVSAKSTASTAEAAGAASLACEVSHPGRGLFKGRMQLREQLYHAAPASGPRAERHCASPARCFRRSTARIAAASVLQPHAMAMRSAPLGSLLPALGASDILAPVAGEGRFSGTA